MNYKFNSIDKFIYLIKKIWIGQKNDIILYIFEAKIFSMNNIFYNLENIIYI